MGGHRGAGGYFIAQLLSLEGCYWSKYRYLWCAFIVMKFTTENVKERALVKEQWPIELRGGLPLVFSPLLKRFSNLAHAFSTRKGGASKPPFDSFNVGINHTTDEETRRDARSNRVLLCQSLNKSSEHLITAERLVHSADVVMLETVGKPGEVDGIVTRTTARPLYMTYADCVPVIIYDTVKHVLCLVHAGWRGTASGISAEAVRFMVKECNSQVGDLVAAVGPAIGSCCYPVGCDVVLALMSTFTDSFKMYQQELDEYANESNESELISKIWLLIEKLGLEGFFIRGLKQIHVDLKAINAYQMLSLNVSHIDVTHFCTACEKDLFYSFRRSYVNQEGNTGRQAAIACLL